MPKYSILCEATLENLYSFGFKPNTTPIDLFIKFQCLCCHELTDSFICIDNLGPKVDSGSGKDSSRYNSVFKCKFCKKEQGCVDLLQLSEYNASLPAKVQAIAVLECRGFVPSQFSWRKENCLIAHSALVDEDAPSGTIEKGKSVFDDVDLSEGDEWYGYDEATGVPVSISEVKITFEKNKD